MASVGYLTRPALIQRGWKLLRQFISKVEQARTPFNEPKIQDVLSKTVPNSRSGIKNRVTDIRRSQAHLVTRNRSRYEFRLPSYFRMNKNVGKLSQTVARYGFVAIGVAGGCQWTHLNTDDQKEDLEYASMLRNAYMFCSKNQVSDDSASILSEDSDIIILNDQEESEEMNCSVFEDDEPIVPDPYETIDGLTDEQKMDLYLYLQECLFRQNSSLENQAMEEHQLVCVESELSEALSIVERQHQQLCDLRRIVERQNLSLKMFRTQPMHYACYEKLSVDLEPEHQLVCVDESELSEALSIVERQHQQLCDLHRIVERQNLSLKMFRTQPMHYACYEKLSVDLEPEHQLVCVESELSEALSIVERQHKQLCDLRRIVERQNLSLKMFRTQPMHYARYEKWSVDLEPDIGGLEGCETEEELSFEIIDYDFIE